MTISLICHPLQHYETKTTMRNIHHPHRRHHQKFDDSCDKSAKALLITIVVDRTASAIKIWVNYGDKNCNRANEGGDNHRLGLNHQIF